MGEARATQAGVDWRLVATIAMAIALGLWLRAYQVDAQILIDDEWHAIIKLANSSYADIARSFGVADHSIPLTLLYKWIADSGHLSEGWMIAPAFACGIGLLVLPVLAVRRGTAPFALAVFAFLLAISPLLVHYTRQARPYSISVLFGLIAIASIFRWSQRRETPYALLYVAFGTAAIYLHMIVAPAVLGALGAMLLLWCRDPRRTRADLAKLFALGLVMVAFLALLLAPAISNDWLALRAKSRGDVLTFGGLERTWHMFAGTAWQWLALLCLVLVGIGTVELWRRHHEPAFVALVLIVLQFVAVVMSGAMWLNHPLVLSRYLLICLPPILYAMAVGFAWCCSRFKLRAASAPLLAAFLCALYWSGPLPVALAYPNNFFTHYVYFFDIDPRENRVLPVLEAGPIPAFYRDLAAYAPGSRTLIEAPWRFESIFNRLPLFQQVHRQNVKIGLIGGICPPGGVAEEPRQFPNKFRQLVDLAKAPGDLQRDADFLVFHRNLELSNMEPPWTLPDGRALPSVGECIARFQKEFGEPVFEDATITVFALRAPSP
jgi:hypothetical protein